MGTNEQSYLIAELNLNMLNKIDKFFEHIRDIIRTKSKTGTTSLIIFYPLSEDTMTTGMYDIKIHDKDTDFTDSKFRNNLVHKFKSQGIKLTIYQSVECTIGLANTKEYKHVGHLLFFKWDRDYSQTCCTCTII